MQGFSENRWPAEKFMALQGLDIKDIDRSSRWVVATIHANEINKRLFVPAPICRYMKAANAWWIDLGIAINPVWGSEPLRAHHVWFVCLFSLDQWSPPDTSPKISCEKVANFNLLNLGMLMVQWWKMTRLAWMLTWLATLSSWCEMQLITQLLTGPSRYARIRVCQESFEQISRY